MVPPPAGFRGVDWFIPYTRNPAQLPVRYDATLWLIRTINHLFEPSSSILLPVNAIADVLAANEPVWFQRAFSTHGTGQGNPNRLVGNLISWWKDAYRLSSVHKEPMTNTFVNPDVAKVPLWNLELRGAVPPRIMSPPIGDFESIFMVNGTGMFVKTEATTLLNTFVQRSIYCTRLFVASVSPPASYHADLDAPLRLLDVVVVPSAMDTEKSTPSLKAAKKYTLGDAMDHIHYRSQKARHYLGTSGSRLLVEDAFSKSYDSHVVGDLGYFAKTLKRGDMADQVVAVVICSDSAWLGPSPWDTIVTITQARCSDESVIACSISGYPRDDLHAQHMQDVPLGLDCIRAISFGEARYLANLHNFDGMSANEQRATLNQAGYTPDRVSSILKFMDRVVVVDDTRINFKVDVVPGTRLGNIYRRPPLQPCVVEELTSDEDE